MDSYTSRRFYRILLRLYPASFRESYGGEMEEVFLASLSVERKRWGRIGTVIGWSRALQDTAWHVCRLRLGVLVLKPGTQGGRWRGPSWSWGSLLEELGAATRHLRRNRGFTLTAIITLALGIGLNTAVFGAVYSLLMRSPPGIEDTDGLVHLYRTSGSEAEFLPNSLPLFRDLQGEMDVFSGVLAWTFASLSTDIGDRSERVMAQVVSAGFFEVLGIPMVQGRGFSGPGRAEGSGERVVVVSERFWRNQLESAPDVLGRTIGINGTPWEIIGVAPGEFRGPLPVFPPALWAPLSAHPDLLRGGDQSENRGNNFLEVVARLNPESAAGQEEEWASRFASRLREAHPEVYQEIGFTLHPLERTGIHPSIRTTQAGLSWIVMGVVALFLLVACLNVAGLFLAKAQSRRKEVAVRRSLGSSRGRLISQFLLESLILSLAAGAVGLFLARLAVDGMNAIHIPFDWALDWNIGLGGPVLAFNLGVTVLASVVFGLVPAIRSSDPDLVPSLKGSSSQELGRSPRSGRILVGTQIAASTVLLVLAGLFGKNLRDAMILDTGFDHSHLALATLDPGSLGYDGEEGIELFRNIMERVRTVPGVASVGLGRFLPMGVDGAQRLVEIPGYQLGPGESMNIRHNVVDSDYFQAMGIPILEGRGFSGEDGEGGSKAAVVNQRFAHRFWPGEYPIGKSFLAGGREWEVVGVVPTGKYQRLGEAPTPFMYLPWPALRSEQMTVHVRTNVDPSTLLPVLRGEVQEIAPGLSVTELKTMEAHLGFALLPARLSATVLGVFGALCLLLMSVGIHGVVAFSVSRRSRELGIRVALGADRWGATILVLKEEARVVMAGVLAGLAVILSISGLIQGLLYSGEVLEPGILVLTPLFLASVALGSAFLPAREAARIDPAHALRRE